MNMLQQLAQSSYGYTTYTTSSSSNDLDPAAAAALIVFGIITFIIAYVVSAILLGRIFKKAGVPTWMAWVPVYNSWKMLEIGGQNGFWAVLALIPIVNYVSIVFVFIAMYNIGLKLGKSGAFVVLGIFLPLVWMIWLAVDSSTWNESLGAPSKAVEHLGRSNPPATPTTTVL
ncbi:signal peptidase I [Candidatus Saccharibacteria bacterium]|nr:signal peptidase I [Candidatus Saccharibacteria bacterium]